MKIRTCWIRCWVLLLLAIFLYASFAQQDPDFLRALQLQAVETEKSNWMHWGDQPGVYSSWTNHSNRLIPIYSFGIQLDSVRGENSVYRDAEKIQSLYGKLPVSTLNPDAEYFDQTDVYRLQQQALASGKKHIILMVFDGMDWQTTQAAAIYKAKKVVYTEGRGTGLAFLDYQGGPSDYGFFVTAPYNNDPKADVNSQTVIPGADDGRSGGYAADFGGKFPWARPGDPAYLIGQRKSLPHLYTDSAASATSMTTGRKTFNAAINVGPMGEKLETIADQCQRQGYGIGVVTSVPISHATPACAYAHNVSRDDYQDLSRDLLGLKSVSHRDDPLAGVDVLIGCGWGENMDDDREKQGQNFVPGNKFLTASVLAAIDVREGGRYVVAQRTANCAGETVLAAATEQTIETRSRLFGFFGVGGGHLPFQTADGKYDPTRGVKSAERYSDADVSENPTLAAMTIASLSVLQHHERGFWLMVEAGDVDWANHNNNIDDSIGAVLSGEAAFNAITNWVEKNSSWDETVLIVTSDHGHLLFVDDLPTLTGTRKGADIEVKQN